jgi:hypothetical protein
LPCLLIGRLDENEIPMLHRVAVNCAPIRVPQGGLRLSISMGSCFPAQDKLCFGFPHPPKFPKDYGFILALRANPRMT